MIEPMRNRILLACAAVALAACNGTTAPVSEGYTSLPADNVMIDVQHAMTNGGIRRSLLKSDTTYMFNDSATVQLRGVHLEMYTETGTLRATLTSTAGELDQNTNRMVARGDVHLVVTGPNARQVWTEELHYDPSQGRLWSEVAFRTRTSDGQQIRGDAFTSDETFSNFRITNMRGTGIRVPM
jgi:LPS export ABC transporter protein LptC